MKKIFLSILVFGAAMIFSASIANAQYAKGDKLLNVGIGLNSYYSGGIPLTAALEVGVTDDISVGGSVSLLSHDYSYGGKFTALYIGGRGSYHVNKLLNFDNDKIDLYAGLALGYRNFSWKDTYSGSVLGGSYGSGIYFGGFIGGRYYFSNNIGAFAELGAGGSSNANIGLTFKF
jgi:hypothetical protein